jgi:hypothetical protein
MRHYGLPISSFLLTLILVAAIVLACGSPAGPSNTTGILESVSLSPATADAQNYPLGLVPFTATGYYSTPPSPVTPLKATWGACYQGNPTSGISVSNSGVAQCAAGSAGTFTVWAWAPSGTTGACPAFGTACGGGGCQVTGTAQLTCP